MDNDELKEKLKELGFYERMSGHVFRKDNLFIIFDLLPGGIEMDDNGDRFIYDLTADQVLAKVTAYWLTGVLD